MSANFYDLQELTPKVYLKDPDNMKVLEHQLSPPKSKSDVQSSTPLPPSQTPTQQQHPGILPRLSIGMPKGL